MTTVLLVAAAVFGLVVATAGALVLGLVVRTARADKAGRQRSDLAGAPERLAHRDLPELHTSRINIQERP